MVQKTISLNEQAILSVLAEDPNRELWGIEIMNQVNESFFQGDDAMNAGSLYPTLNKLKKEGYIGARWGDEDPQDTNGARRRYYKITGEGEKALRKTAELQDRMKRMWAPRGSWEPQGT